MVLAYSSCVQEGQILVLRFGSQSSMSAHLERVSNAIEEKLSQTRTGHNFSVRAALAALGAEGQSGGSGGRRRDKQQRPQQPPGRQQHSKQRLQAACVPLPLTEEERDIEKLLRRSAAAGCRYCVAFLAGDWRTQQHEMRHARFFLDESRRHGLGFVPMWSIFMEQGRLHDRPIWVLAGEATDSC